MATICIVDDDTDVLATLAGYFERAGHGVIAARTGSEGIRAVGHGSPDVVLLDLELPDISGIEVLEAIRGVNPVVLVLSGHVDTARAIDAMRMGAEGVLSKPIDLELLAAATDRAIEKARLRQMSSSIGYGGTPVGHGALLGSSPAMHELARQIELFARSDPTPVLLVGESGTGKGRVARTLHGLGPRRAGAFVQASCTGLSVGLLDAELFGVEGGGRHAAKAMGGAQPTGLLEAAGGGTLFLEEIGALHSRLQPKLLEVLEGSRMRLPGETREVPIDVRLVASTARDLVTEIAEGRFREDLYYRVSIMPLHVPPLRARAREDILQIAALLLDELRSQLPDSPAKLSEEGQDHLLRYSWPGNVRELRNILERSMILARGKDRIEADHLPTDIRRAPLAGAERHTPRSLAEVERLHIERTLRVHDQNRTRAARELGISRATLINKIKTYALMPAVGSLRPSQDHKEGGGG